MSDNKTLFDAKLENNRLTINIYAGHIPMLAYALKQLEIEIEKRIVASNIAQEISDAPKIVVPDNSRHKIVDWMRGKKK